MDADRQAVFLGGRVDRPVVALAQRMVVHHQQQDLHEAAVGGDAVDLLDRQFGVLHRHHDGGAQAWLLVEPLGGDPVVHRAGEAGAHVLAEQELHAVEAVADGDAGAERGEGVGAECVEVGAGPGVGQAPVGAGGERRVGGVGDRFQLVHAALDDDVAPVVGEVGVQGAEVGHGGMDVAVDAAWFDDGHARVLSGRLPMRRINVGATTVQLSENASMPCFPQYSLRRLDNPCRVRGLVWSSQWCAMPTVNMLEAKSNLSRLV